MTLHGFLNFTWVLFQPIKGVVRENVEVGIVQIQAQLRWDRQLDIAVNGMFVWMLNGMHLYRTESADNSNIQTGIYIALIITGNGYWCWGRSI